MTHYEKILYYFKELNKIPRESSDEKGISQYLVAFAKERNLEVIYDTIYNVIIKKPATIENCTSDAIIIQGHSDMVYVKTEESTHDYSKGIEVLEKDGWIYADGTTLGADNGLAVAYALAILDSDDILHPDLEVVITAQEETGLDGVQALDGTLLKGKYLLNLDSEEEGVFLTSCAGGISGDITIPITREPLPPMQCVKLKIKGLNGGHSGAEIHMGKGNAIKYLGKLLDGIKDIEFKLCTINAPGKSNAIALMSEAVIAIANEDMDRLTTKIIELECVFKNELAFTDEIILDINKVDRLDKAYSQESKYKIITAINLLPFGVMHRSFAIENLVETSTNLGVLVEKEDCVTIVTSTRSSIASYKYDVVNNQKRIAELLGLKAEFSSDYPQWSFRKDCPLQKKIKEVYIDMYGVEPVFTAIHAGLECGFFDKKLPDVSMISFGPNIKDVHTPKERAEIQSINNIWDFLVVLLSRI